MRCKAMQVTKNVDVNLIREIIPLPNYTGKIVTVTVSDYIPQKTNKKVVLNAMSKLENGIKPSTKSLNDFKAERLAKYEVIGWY